MGRKRFDLDEQVKIRVRIEDNGCWTWLGKKAKNGYGHIFSLGKTYLAHRISYELYVGKIPRGLVIDHKCRNRICINPEHLEIVTLKENILRGKSISAKNSKKIYCKRNHILVGDNLVKRDDNIRQCRLCKNLAQLEYTKRRKLLCP